MSKTSQAVPINFTDRAFNYIQSLPERSNAKGLRLGIKTGKGCSGFAYQLDYVEQVRPEDMTFSVEGLTVFIDSEWYDFLKGTQIDYVKDKDNLNARLAFINPNEAARCGCGESFSIED